MKALPVELLILIFAWATYGPIRDIDSIVHSIPSDSSKGAEDGIWSQTALAIKCALSCVCRQWRILSEPFLYEELWIGRGSATLAHNLELSSSKSRRNVNLHVMRIFLPDIHDKLWHTSSGYALILRILRCCPNTAIISRNPYVSTQLDNAYIRPGESREDHCDLFSLIIDAGLNNVRRLDWGGAMSRCYPRPTTVFNGSISAFEDSIPSLEVLSLGPDNSQWQPDSTFFATAPRVLILPNVHTLHYHSSQNSADVIVSRALLLPALQLLNVCGSSYRADFDTTFRHARQVRTFMIGFSSSKKPSLNNSEPLAAAHHLRRALALCRDVEVVWYPVLAIQDFVRVIAPSVECVGLYAKSLDDVSLRTGVVCGVRVWGPSQPYRTYSQWAWAHLLKHFTILLGSDTPFPSLQHIILHGGDWHKFITEPKFQSVTDLAKHAGVVITYQKEMPYASVNPLDWRRTKK